MRIERQLDGYGVAIHAGRSRLDSPDGEWSLQLRVRDSETLQVTERVVKFSVDSERGKPVPQGSPADCLPDGRPGPTPPPDTSRASPAPRVTKAPGPSPAGGSEKSDDSGGGPDVLELALLTIAAAGGAAVLGLIGYLIRLRVGFWLHRPPPRDGNGGAEHH
jgi:hypothetical protein